ncbi:beta-1,3-galactosyl-O-glycosyl-glycoprotein beta-1,6-N-acetylglucosaminyltransferase 3 isoform X1 [Argonauta hians]
MMKRARLFLLVLLLYSSITFTLWTQWNSIKFCDTKSELRSSQSNLKRSNNYEPATESTTQYQVSECAPHRKKKVNCKLLIKGDPDYISKVNSIKEDENKEESCTLKELVKNCTKLIQAHGYFNKPVTKMELDYPIAFAIKMHKSPIQFERLLRTIYLPHNVYCIHVDAKTDQNTFDLIKNITACLPNVFLVENRVNVVYATYMHVKAELECIKACTRSDVAWKYYINLTGQEFPLKTNLELVEILKIFNGTNDIEAYKHPKSLDWRVKYKIEIGDNGLTKTNHNKQPLKYNVQLYKGSAYGMFSRDFVDFMLQDNVVAEIFKWMNDTYSPEENIWATINALDFAPGGYGNIEIRHDKYTHVSKAVIWSWDGFKCLGKTIRSICIFSIGDLMWLNSRPEIVANKFYEETDSIVLDCLEESIKNRTFQQNVDHLNWHYYRNLPHVKHNANINAKEKNKEFLQKKKEIWLLKQKSLMKSDTTKTSVNKTDSKSVKTNSKELKSNNIIVKFEKQITENPHIKTQKTIKTQNNNELKKANSSNIAGKNIDSNIAHKEQNRGNTISTNIKKT